MRVPFCGVKDSGKEQGSGDQLAQCEMTLGQQWWHSSLKERKKSPNFGDELACRMRGKCL